MTVGELIEVLADWSPDTPVEILHPNGIYPISHALFADEFPPDQLERRNMELETLYLIVVGKRTVLKPD